MSYEIELSGTMADIPIFIREFQLCWILRYPNQETLSDIVGNADDSSTAEAEMLSGDYEHAKNYLLSWFGNDIKLVLPKLRQEQAEQESMRASALKVLTAKGSSKVEKTTNGSALSMRQVQEPAKRGKLSKWVIKAAVRKAMIESRDKR